MAAHHGKGGSFTFGGGQQLNVTSWTLDVTSETAETTDMDDTYKNYLPGFMDWTATIECMADSGGYEVGLTAMLTAIGTIGTAILSDGNYKWTATSTAFVKDINITTDMNDAVKQTIVLLGSGVIVQASV